MPDFPDDFVADMRSTRAWPELVDTLWRSPTLMRLTYGRLWELVAEVLPPAPARIVEVGAGTGSVALELARAGHDVAAVEPDDTAIELARRALDRVGDGPGRLTYHQAEIESWEPDTADFDAIVTARVLHHVVDPAEVLARLRGWLRPGGRLIVVDFFYDHFDRRSALWLAQARSLLEAASQFHAHHDDPLPVDPDEAVRRLEAEWRREHEDEEMLNKAAAILDPLHDHFQVDELSWHPYLYWELLLGLQVDDPAVEREVGRRYADWERQLLDVGALPGLIARIVAHPPTHA